VTREEAREVRDVPRVGVVAVRDEMSETGLFHPGSDSVDASFVLLSGECQAVQRKARLSVPRNPCFDEGHLDTLLTLRGLGGQPVGLIRGHGGDELARVVVARVVENLVD